MPLSADYIHLICGSTDLDLGSAVAATTGNIIIQWEPNAPELRQTRHTTAFKHGTDIRSSNYDNVTETMNVTIFGTNQDDLLNKVQSLYNMQELAKENAQRPANVKANPVYLVYQPRFATNASQSEVFRVMIKPIKNTWTGPDLINNRFNFQLEVERDPFWYSTATINPNLSSTSLTNNGNCFTDVTSVTGAVFAPMLFQHQATGGNSANASMLIAGVRRYYTPSQFKNFYAANEATASNDTVKNAGTNTNFWDGGTNHGATTTPTTKVGDGTGKKMLRWTNSTNVQSQYGSFHVFARCRDNAGATPSFKIRLKAGVTAGGVDFFGDFTATAVAAAAVGGTTEFYLLDLGRLDIPPINVSGTAVSSLVFELWGDTTVSSAFPTFDFDYFYLIPIGESDNDSGVIQATYPAALGTTFAANIDTRPNGQYPNPAYESLVSGGALAFMPSSWMGTGFYYYPGITNRVFLILARSDGRHDYTTTLSSVVSNFFWRGLYPRGTT